MPASRNARLKPRNARFSAMFSPTIPIDVRDSPTMRNIRRADPSPFSGFTSIARSPKVRSYRDVNISRCGESNRYEYYNIIAGRNNTAERGHDTNANELMASVCIVRTLCWESGSIRRMSGIFVDRRLAPLIRGHDPFLSARRQPQCEELRSGGILRCLGHA